MVAGDTTTVPPAGALTGRLGLPAGLGTELDSLLGEREELQQALVRIRAQQDALTKAAQRAGSRGATAAIPAPPVRGIDGIQTVLTAIHDLEGQIETLRSSGFIGA